MIRLECDWGNEICLWMYFVSGPLSGGQFSGRSIPRKMSTDSDSYHDPSDSTSLPKYKDCAKKADVVEAL